MNNLFTWNNFRNLLLSTLGTSLLLTSCYKASRDTDYSLNRQQDKAAGRSTEEIHEYIESGVGSDVYDGLVADIGQSNLDTLSYGAGESNLINLINEVISCGGTAQKLVDLIANTPASPTKISAETVVGLINETDYHLRNETPLPHGDDTISKIAKMVCEVSAMDDLVYIVNNVEDWSGGGSPPETDGLKRLSLVIALINENPTGGATVGNMPETINVVANTTEGRVKLLRILNEVPDLRKLTTIVNETTVLGNLLTIINNVTNTGSPNGMDALITTLNLVTKPEDMAGLVNNLDAASSDVNNDETFEGTGSGGIDQNWAITGHLLWGLDNTSGTPQGSWAAKSPAGLGANQGATVELAVNVMSGVPSPTVSFRRRVSSHSSDYLKFYIDDVLMGIWSGTVGWSTVSYNVTDGVHRLRWEYMKDGSLTGGDDAAWIDDIQITGDAGTTRTAAEKVAILLNQLNIDSQDTVANIMNGLNTDTWGNTGLDNMSTLVNLVEYPLNIDDEPRLVSIVNGIFDTATMTELIRGLDNNGVLAIVELMDHAPDVLQVSDLVNEMDSAGLGTKMTDILNGLNSAGQYNLAKTVDGVDNTDLVTLIENATQTSHMSDIFNNIYLRGSVTHTTVSTSSGSSGGSKLTDVINLVDSNANLSISSHLVRLINDIAASPQGASSVGKIVGLLNPQAANASGQQRMVALLDTLNLQGTPNYTDELSNATNDDFGRVITLLNSMGGNGPDNLTRLINEVSCNDIGNVNDCRVYNMADMVLDSTRVVYVSRLISELTNIDLLIELLNHPDTNFSKIQTLLNEIGDAGYPGGSPPADTYDNQMEWPTTDDDYLGRLIVTINNVSGDGGVANLITLVNNVSYTDGVTDNFSIIIDLVKNSHRIVYMTRMVSEAQSLDIVIELINSIDPGSATERTRLLTLINDFGDDSYSTSTGVASAPSPVYGASPSGGSGAYSCPNMPYSPGVNVPEACDTNSTDPLGRMIVLLNDMTTQTLATGSSMSQAIFNVVSMIMDANDLNFIIGFMKQIDRIRYVTHLVSQIDNIGLMMKIINGYGAVPGADLTKMLRIMNNFGGSNRKGENYTTGKSVGDMTMFANVIDELGVGRTDEEQVRITQLMNDVVYCGIKPQYDRSIPVPGTASDIPVLSSTYFETCDTDVDFDYNANKNNIHYDQRHRVANIMLGLNDAATMAIIVGDVSDVRKTIATMNGTRRINTIIHTVNWLPAEATRDLMNYTNGHVIYASLVYMANNLAPDEYEAAQAFAALIHYGTGLAGQSNDRKTGTCKYYTGIGPKRMSGILNMESGEYLEGILTMFGWRTAIPAMVCAFGTPNEGTPQTVNGAISSQSFAREEYLKENADQTGSNLAHYRVTDNDACYTHPVPDPCGGAYDPACTGTNYGFLKEESGALGFNEKTDAIVWKGFSPLPGISVDPGLGGVWDVLKGSGIVGWLLQNGGSLSAPPVDTDSGAPNCTQSGLNDEWSCIQVGKDSAPNISLHRWGNYCSLPQYSTSGPCESNGGRWMPDKHYENKCFIDPATDSPYGN
jgi:hypothetical protein